MDQPLLHPIDLNDAAVVDAYDELPLWSDLFGALLLSAPMAYLEGRAGS